MLIKYNNLIIFELINIINIPYIEYFNKLYR